MRLPVFITLFFLSGYSYAVTITGLAFTKSSYEKYEKAEASFALGTSYSNPYDSTIVQADAEITPPSGPVFLVPCFYYVPCTYALVSGTNWNGTENTAGAKWMLRYTPTLTGTYQVRIRVLDGATSYSGAVSFTVVNSSRKGFIRIDATNNQFMRFDDNTPYYPVGYNSCWNNGELVKFYNDWINTRMGPNNVTWMRYWLTDFARQALEWRNGHWSGWYSGLGRYSQRAAGMLDSVLNNCDRQGIYMQLVLQHHGQFSTSTNPEWTDNPYNSANGGPAANSGDFFVNTGAKSYTKKLYRYIVARWGYSTNIMSWELFNEVEFSDGTDANIDAWHDEMSRYLKAQDPNDHIVNTSCGGDNSTMPLFDNNPAMDQLQWHTYAGSIEKVLYNEAQTFKAAYNKPVLCGEFGTAGSYTGHPDNLGDHVRKSMWIGMMNAAPNMFWYWDEYVQTKNLYSLFKPLSDYLANEDIVSATSGNAKKPRISVNPLITGTVLVSPTQSNWSGTNVPNPFTSTVDANGNASNVNGLYRYLHGSYQGTRNRVLNFTVTFQTAGTVVLNVASVAASATKIIEVRVDGSLVTTWTPTGAGNLTYTGIAAGTHTIQLYNAGQDWVEFNNISFTNVGLRALDAWGYTGSTKAYGYVNDVSYGDWAASTPNITTSALRVGPLTAGSYNIEYWDPKTGAITNGGTASTTLDSLTLTLPTFNKDIAYKITPVALPVELLHFEGSLNHENLATLYWTTLTETGNASFEIQRSKDGKSFYPCGKIAGNQSTQQQQFYVFNDPEPVSGNVYYRLKQTDLDGNYSMSNIIVLSAQEEKIRVYPNPAREKLLVAFPPSIESCTLELYNTVGRIVSSEEYKLANGTASISLNLQLLEPSVYFLKLTFETGNSQVIRFVKY